MWTGFTPPWSRVGLVLQYLQDRPTPLGEIFKGKNKETPPSLHRRDHLWHTRDMWLMSQGCHRMDVTLWLVFHDITCNMSQKWCYRMWHPVTWCHRNSYTNTCDSMSHNWPSVTQCHHGNNIWSALSQSVTTLDLLNTRICDMAGGGGGEDAYTSKTCDIVCHRADLWATPGNLKSQDMHHKSCDTVWPVSVYINVHF